MAAWTLPTRSGRVISRQGWRTLPGEATRWHNGVDFAGAEGDPIFAVADGTIAAVYPSGAPGVRGYGNVIVIRHAADVLSVYAHCLDTRADVGAAVRAGEQIARIGRTSGRGGNPAALIGVAHLHLELVRRWPLLPDDRAARYDVGATLAPATVPPAPTAAGPAPPWPNAPGATMVAPPGTVRSMLPARGTGALTALAIIVIVARRRRST